MISGRVPSTVITFRRFIADSTQDWIGVGVGRLRIEHLMSPEEGEQVFVAGVFDTVCV